MNRPGLASKVILGIALAGAADPVAAADSAPLRLPDGATVAYEDRGTGVPALVFLHCGNCSAAIWSETLDAFAPTHRVVAPDLPGYGRSATGARERFSIAVYGADVAALVEHLDLAQVILVGNSLGGPVALEAARRLGRDRVLGVVAVDTLHDVRNVFTRESWQRVLDAYRSDFEPACTEMMLGLLPEDAPPATRERIDRETCDNDPKAAIALFETLLDYDMAASLSGAGVPVRAINSTAIPTSVEENRKHAPDFDVVPMEGVGHYPQVERPAEFQVRLREVVDSLARRPQPKAAPPGLGVEPETVVKLAIMEL